MQGRKGIGGRGEEVGEGDKGKWPVRRGGGVKRHNDETYGSVLPVDCIFEVILCLQRRKQKRFRYLL
jgi:hypothetical protein